MPSLRQQSDVHHGNRWQREMSDPPTAHVQRHAKKAAMVVSSGLPVHSHRAETGALETAAARPHDLHLSLAVADQSRSVQQQASPAAAMARATVRRVAAMARATVRQVAAMARATVRQVVVMARATVRQRVVMARATVRQRAVTASRSLATAKAAAAQQQAGDIAPPSPATLGNQKKPDGHDGRVAPALRCSRPGRPLRSGDRLNFWAPCPRTRQTFSIQEVWLYSGTGLLGWRLCFFFGVLWDGGLGWRLCFCATWKAGGGGFLGR